MADEYLCVTVRSQPDESEANFKARLSAFWTIMLRHHKDDFEKVYAEKVEFEHIGDHLARQYLIEASIAELLEIQFRSAGIDFAEIDQDEIYSKYEATPPEWMWIEH